MQFGYRDWYRQISLRLNPDPQLLIRFLRKISELNVEVARYLGAEENRLTFSCSKSPITLFEILPSASFPSNGAVTVRYSFAVAARSLLSFRSDPQSAVSQSVQVHT